MGIGGRGDDVYTVHHKGLAAVVSHTPLVVYDPTRENVFAHEQVNETVMREFTVLPMAFGALFRTEDDIVELIRGTYDALRDVLTKMEGKVEFGLKVNWDRDKVTAELEEKDDEIRHLKEQIVSRTTGSTYFARMQLGRLIETALTDQADAYIREVYSQLRDTAVASRANKPIGDRMIMNAAFLIERDREAEFDQKVKRLLRSTKASSRSSTLVPGRRTISFTFVSSSSAARAVLKLSQANPQITQMSNVPD